MLHLLAQLGEKTSSYAVHAAAAPSVQLENWPR
jgi:hypothetical protein